MTLTEQTLTIKETMTFEFEATQEESMAAWLEAPCKDVVTENYFNIASKRIAEAQLRRHNATHSNHT